MASPSSRPTLQQAMLLGVVILAFAAILIAWMDQSGILKVLYDSFDNNPY